MVAKDLLFKCSKPFTFCEGRGHVLCKKLPGKFQKNSRKIPALEYLFNKAPGPQLVAILFFQKFFKIFQKIFLEHL